MRNTLNLCRGMLLSVALLMLPGAAMAAGFSDKLAEKVTNDPQAREQIKNAADALEVTVESAVTKGEATRGASGPLMQLVYNSDTLICSAWIISFRQELQRLSIKQEPSVGDLNVWRAARELLTRVERACQDVLQPGTGTSVTTPGTGGTATPSPTDTPLQASLSRHDRAGPSQTKSVPASARPKARPHNVPTGTSIGPKPPKKMLVTSWPRMSANWHRRGKTWPAQKRVLKARMPAWPVMKPSPSHCRRVRMDAATSTTT